MALRQPAHAQVAAAAATAAHWSQLAPLHCPPMPAAPGLPNEGQRGAGGARWAKGAVLERDSGGLKPPRNAATASPHLGEPMAQPCGPPGQSCSTCASPPLLPPLPAPGMEGSLHPFRRFYSVYLRMPANQRSAHNHAHGGPLHSMEQEVAAPVHAPCSRPGRPWPPLAAPGPLSCQPHNKAPGKAEEVHLQIIKSAGQA